MNPNTPQQENVTSQSTLQPNQLEPSNNDSQPVVLSGGTAQPPAHHLKKSAVTIIFVVVLILVVAGVAYTLGRNSRKFAPITTISDFKTADAAVQETFQSIQAKARDTERQTDIKAIHGQVEAFWAQFGYYPSLANLNDSAFRITNMKGLDNEALKDPQGSGYLIAASPVQYSYAYTVLPANCDDSKTRCTSYTLTATTEQELNGKKVYYKTSLNN